jgi:hypothetical protein
VVAVALRRCMKIDFSSRRSSFLAKRLEVREDGKDWGSSEILARHVETRITERCPFIPESLKDGLHGIVQKSNRQAVNAG